MTDPEKIERALVLIKEACALVGSVEAGDNEHLQSYAIDGLASAPGYLETLRRRLINPDDDQ